MNYKNLYRNDSNYMVGDPVMVFDTRLWDKNGGDSKDDSFFRSATI